MFRNKNAKAFSCSMRSLACSFVTRNNQRFRLECSKSKSRSISNNINFFYIFSPKTNAMQQYVSKKQLRKLGPNFRRSQKMIKSVFPIFRKTRFLSFQTAKKHKKRIFALALPKLPERFPKRPLRGDCSRTTLDD